MQDPSPSRLLDLIYGQVLAAEHLAEERHRLTQAVRSLLEKLRRKLVAQEEERREAVAAEDYRICGELLTTYLYLVLPGMTEIRVPDYYSPDGGEPSIALDPRLSPSANAQVCFKRYQKAKRALNAVEGKLAGTLAEITYLEGVEASLDNVETLAEVAEVAAELTAGGYLSATTRSKTPPGHKPKPRRSGEESAQPAASRWPSPHPME